MDIKTQVVRIRRKKTGEVVQDCDVYIGRRMTLGGWNLPQSKWANPFPVKKEAERAEVLRKYEEWIRTQPQLMASLEELRGKRLGCWCKPKACHGDILIRLMDEQSSRPMATMQLTGHDRLYPRQLYTGNIQATPYAQKGLVATSLPEGELVTVAYIPPDVNQMQ